MSDINYIIKEKCIYLESDSKDNPLIPHIDSEGNSIAVFNTPYTIVEGMSAKLQGHSLTVCMTGKRGNKIVFKIPADAIKVMAEAIENLKEDENPINRETLENINVAIEDLQNDESNF